MQDRLLCFQHTLSRVQNRLLKKPSVHLGPPSPAGCACSCPAARAAAGAAGSACDCPPSAAAGAVGAAAAAACGCCSTSNSCLSRAPTVQLQDTSMPMLPVKLHLCSYSEVSPDFCMKQLADQDAARQQSACESVYHITGLSTELLLVPDTEIVAL